MQTKKQTIKQKIMATVVVLFMMVMMFGAVDLGQLNAQTTTTTNLIQNFVAGTLWHEAMQNIAFNNITVGVAANSLANMTQTNVWDMRGSAAGWALTGYVNTLTTATAGVNTLTNAFIAWNPATGAITAITGSATGVAPGTAGYFSNAGGRLLINAAVGSGMGNYRINNVTLNIVYNGRPDQAAGTYQALLTLTTS